MTGYEQKMYNDINRIANALEIMVKQKQEDLEMAKDAVKIAERCANVNEEMMELTKDNRVKMDELKSEVDKKKSGVRLGAINPDRVAKTAEGL